MLTVEDAMRLANVSRVTIFTWIREGKIERIKLPGKKRIMIDKEKFQAFLQTGAWSKNGV